MKYVELIKGIDYRGHGINAKKKQRILVDDSKSDELVGTGFFKICEELPVSDDVDNGADSKKDDGSGVGAPSNVDKPVNKMNGTELKAYAEAKGYDISECTKVEEIRALILELDSKDDE